MPIQECPRKDERARPFWAIDFLCSSQGSLYLAALSRLRHHIQVQNLNVMSQESIGLSRAHPYRLTAGLYLARGEDRQNQSHHTSNQDAFMCVLCVYDKHIKETDCKKKDIYGGRLKYFITPHLKPCRQVVKTRRNIYKHHFTSFHIMALSDPMEMITTDMQNISYIAGQEPWNKNLDIYTFDTKQTNQSSYQCDWTKWHGIYRTIPEARSTIDVWCSWVVGAKLIMDEKTKKITDRWKGAGNDTLRKILKNLKRTSKICGVAFADAPRDKAGRITNLKPLNPGTIKVTANKNGIIEKFEQMSSTNESEAVVLETWEPDEMFYLTNDRIADEIHGIPELEKTYKIMKWKHQSMGDLATMFHRYIQPILEIYANTDDPTELASIEATYTKSRKFFENRIIPKGAIEKVDRISIPQFSTLDPLPWQKFLRSYYTESSNVPDLVRGKSDEVSLAAGKLNIFAYKHKIIMEQLEYSEEIKSQLGLDVSFEEPPEIDIEMVGPNLGVNNTNEAD